MKVLIHVITIVALGQFACKMREDSAVAGTRLPDRTTFGSEVGPLSYDRKFDCTATRPARHEGHQPGTRTHIVEIESKSLMMKITSSNSGEDREITKVAAVSFTDGAFDGKYFHEYELKHDRAVFRFTEVKAFTDGEGNPEQMEIYLVEKSGGQKFPCVDL